LADGTGRRLASGANDRRVLLWDWTVVLPASLPWSTDASGGGAGAPLLHAINHGAKVNCVVTASTASGARVLLVGGTQRRLHVYELQ